ncbi:MAG: Rpn family recombination-promoting nuclease/putative transposase [Holosporales bacterium]|jgi:predicted transposase/invertase (TIGR01784 family)|nr:Rpn family recombination-promoting nuclease/putative transposase [Holosporales bacterium]
MHGFSKDCPLTLWVEYLKNPLSKTVKKIMEFEPIIEEAVNMFKTISDDPKTREMIRMREEGILDYNSAIDHAEQIGKLKGLQEGERKGLQEGERRGKLIAARSMLTDGVPVAVVSKYTGIPIAELKDFKDIREE